MTETTNTFKSHTYRGITWTSDRDLSRKLGKGSAYVNRKYRNGKSYEQIIDEVLNGCIHPRLSNPSGIHVYRGITWNNDRELSRKFGMNQNYVYQNRKRGKSYEQIIDEVLNGCIHPRLSNPSSIHEYRGITWTSDRELSRKLGKCSTYVFQCRNYFFKTHEQIIDNVLDNKHKYRGITWTSDRDLSRKLGKTAWYVGYHLHKGKSYEQIIDEVMS